MKKRPRFRPRLLLLVVGLVILIQIVVDRRESMTGAALVHPARDEEFLELGSAPLDWEAVVDWSPEQKTARFRNHDRIYNTRPVRRGEHTFILPSAAAPLQDVKYRIWNFSVRPVVIPMFRRYDIEDFIRHNNIAGLLVIKSGEIVLETYAAGNSAETRWGSWSVAKSVLSMLVGAAIAEGAIQSTDDRVTQYLPDLMGTPYDQVSVEDLLQMSTGMDEEEPTTEQAVVGLSFFDLQASIRGKVPMAEPGTRFNYNDSEANLLGAVLSAAVGEDLVTYLERTIWQPFGMEADGNWLSYPDGLQSGACCLSATLRDYGRLGLYAMHEGRLANGTSSLPDDWMDRSVHPSASAGNYGYLWWLNGDGSYAAMGIFGQLILVNPAEELVIVTQSAWDSRMGDAYYVHQRAFVEAVTAALQ